MNKSLLALTLLSLSSNAFAITEGTPLKWDEHDNMVHMNCTGTLIADKWVLTAAHCEKVAYLGVKTVRNHTIGVKEINNHPDYMSGGIDIALWELNASVDTTQTTFLSMRNVGADERISITGFGQTAPNLNYATLKSREQFSELGARRLMMDTIGEGNSLKGDSGAPLTDTTGAIVGTLAGGSAEASDGIRLYFARDFILEHVNGWHYPTLANTDIDGGTVEVTVQSLHQTDFFDNATYSGDAIITGGTCLGATVAPFETCTYEIESANGEEGLVTLDDGQVITINKGRAEPVTPPAVDHSDGGSLGFLSLFGLLGFGLLRRKHAHAV